MVVDLFLVYQFVRKLTTPFEDWEAYKLGIIDEKGKVLRKRKTLGTSREKNAFGVFDVMILNLKKLLSKLPGGSSKIASYAAALFLIREWNHFSDGSLLTEDVNDEDILESLELFSGTYSYYINEARDVQEKMMLETPTVNVGGGDIAGLGVGPQGEPGVTPAQAARYKRKNKRKKRDLKSFRRIMGENKEDPDIGDKEGVQPASYYKGVKKSVKDDREKHFKKYGKMDDNDPKAYKPAPGDKTAKTKVSKHTKKFKRLYGESSEDLFESATKTALKKKAEKTGISYSILKKVYDRGVAAWRTGHRPGTTPAQWGMARVNSFATGGKTRTTTDADLWKKHKGK